MAFVVVSRLIAVYKKTIEPYPFLTTRLQITSADKEPTLRKTSSRRASVSSTVLLHIPPRPSALSPICTLASLSCAKPCTISITSYSHRAVVPFSLCVLPQHHVALSSFYHQHAYKPPELYLPFTSHPLCTVLFTFSTC